MLPATRSYYGYWRSSSNTTPPSEETNRMEVTIAAPWMRQAWPICQSSSPGSYAAIVDRSPDVALGTSAAVEESSFHLILGTW